MRTVGLHLDLVLEPDADEDEIARNLSDTLSEWIGNTKGVAEVGELRPEPQRFKWVVEIEVHRKWVADGFDLTDDRVQSIMQHHMSYATGEEVGGRVLSAPDQRDIRAAQGYPDKG